MSKLVDRYQMTESECELSSRRALSASTQVSCQHWCHQQLAPCWQFCHQGLDHVDKDHVGTDHVVNRNWCKWSIKSGLFQALRGYSVPGTYQNSEDIQGGKVDLLRMEKSIICDGDRGDATIACRYDHRAPAGECHCGESPSVTT